MTNPPAATIRIATLEDAERLSLLCQQLGYSASPQQMEQRLQQIISHPEHAVYVAQPAAGPVVGWIHAQLCFVLLAPTQVVISGLIVEEQLRGLGIGQQLLQSVEDWAMEHRCRSVLVRSNVIRQAAHRFYENRGYSLIKQSMVFCKPLERLNDAEPNRQ